MPRDETPHLNLQEARGLMLAAQGLLEPPAAEPGIDDLHGMIRWLGALQVDTISVVARSQYLVLWSRLGVYEPKLLDELLYPHRAVFEYWGHAASILPMEDYPYYRLRMLGHTQHMWSGLREWMKRNPEVVQQTLDAIRTRGPLASADFERPPDAKSSRPWDWYGAKESRRALEALWTTGELMLHSRRGGQRVYDLQERVLAEAFGDTVPDDGHLPSEAERLRFFLRRTVKALGIVAPSWPADYFRLRFPAGALGGKRAALAMAFDEMVQEGVILPATVEGLKEPAYVAVERLPDLERLRAGDGPERTTLLSPFDSLIWDRARARALFGYEVCFEAYVVPEKRRYGYYCLAILHRGRLVGRVNPKMDRAGRRLLIRGVYLEPAVEADDTLLTGLAGALHDLARFLDAETIAVEQLDRSEPADVAPALAERLSPPSSKVQEGGDVPSINPLVVS